MSFFEKYKHPFMESSIADYPIVQACINAAKVLPKGATKKNTKECQVPTEVQDHCEAIFRFIFYRYHRESPIYAKRMSSQARDTRALENSEMPQEIYEMFKQGNKFLLSLVLAFLKEEADRDWQEYQAKVISYDQSQRIIFEFDQSGLDEKDKLVQTEKLQKANMNITAFSKEIQTLEARLFGYNNEDNTALAKELQKYAPKVIEGITVDLIKYPCEYFADKDRDTMFNHFPEEKRKKHYQNGKKKKDDSAKPE